MSMVFLLNSQAAAPKAKKEGRSCLNDGVLLTETLKSSITPQEIEELTKRKITILSRQRFEGEKLSNSCVTEYAYAIKNHRLIRWISAAAMKRQERQCEAAIMIGGQRYCQIVAARTNFRNRSQDQFYRSVELRPDQPQVQ